MIEDLNYFGFKLVQEDIIEQGQKKVWLNGRGSFMKLLCLMVVLQYLSLNQFLYRYYII